MGGLSGLSGLSGLGGTAGGGFTPIAGFEYQSILFTAGGSPASAVYGKLDLTYLGSTATLDMSAGLPSVATALGTFESVWGSGNVEVAAVDKGYRLKFVGDLAQYDIQEATLTPSTAYTLNTGTSTPSKTSQRNYTAPVTGSAEVVTLQLTPNDPGQNGQVSDSLGNEVNYDGPLTQYTTQNNIYFAVTSGAGTGTVVFTAGSNDPKGAAGPVFNNNNTSIQPFAVTPGVADVAEVLGQCVISFTGAAGYFTFSDGFTAIAIPVTSTGAEIKSLLNGATGYNASKVDTVTVGASTITIDYASGESPAGTITVGGKTGAAVTAAIDTIQDGANFYLFSLPFDTALDSAKIYKDNGTTLAVAGETVRLGKNKMTAGASLNFAQPSTTKFTLRVGANGKKWLEGDGSGYFDGVVIPCTSGLVFACLFKYTLAGYFNLFEDSDLSTSMVWVDTSKRFELDAGVATISGYDDGAWHRFIEWKGTSGTPGRKVWIDGVLEHNSGTGNMAGTNRTINLFNRGNGNGWKGGIALPLIGSFNPTASIADIDAALAAEIPT